MAGSGGAFSFSQVPGSSSFRRSAVNAVALIPLLSSDKDGEIRPPTQSAQSFDHLLHALKRHGGIGGNGVAGCSAVETDEQELLVVINNSSLTRPGDWRYSDTPLKSFHWQHGCQRLLLFDGRPQHSHSAYDRLMNATTTRDWIDLIPSRRTAAVIGVLNMHDCKDLSDLHRAEEELQQWCRRYAVPPYEVTAHGRDFARDTVVSRLFVFDSFDEDCQSIDLTQTRHMAKHSILAFPPANDAAHQAMMDLHLSLVVNDLAVAVFQSLETKIRDADAITKKEKDVLANSQHGTSQQYQTTPAPSSGGWSRGSFGTWASASTVSDESVGEIEGPRASVDLTLGSMATVLSPDNKLAQESSIAPPPGSKEFTTEKSKSNTFGSLAESAKKATQKALAPASNSASRSSFTNTAVPQLLTPVDQDMDEQMSPSPVDAEAIRKRGIGRREKHAADLALLAGSPLDAYERYLKAAQACNLGQSTTPDPLWYASALEGCAATHIAMAEAGGYSVDEYLENNFQLPDEIMALAKNKGYEDKSGGKKQTLPEVVFALCEEALNITDRHALLAPLHAELLLKLAVYASESAEGHLRCRWGEGSGCYAGEAGDKVPRWEKSSVRLLTFGFDTDQHGPAAAVLKAADGRDLIAINTLERTKRACELMQQAVSVGSLDAATRAQVAERCARMCLHGIKATQWNNSKPERVVLPRKAAFFTSVAAESASVTRDEMATDLWLLATQLYSREGNALDVSSSGGDNCYGWATLRASTLHALSLQGTSSLCQEAVELLLSLLGHISSEIPEEIDESKTIESSLNQSSHHVDENMDTSAARRAEGKGIARKLRDSLTTMTASSAVLAMNSKWADDQPIRPANVPLAEPSDISSTVLALGCVWSDVEYEKCSAAQRRCMRQLLTLHRALPASSNENRIASSIYGIETNWLPIYVSSAMTLQPESTLELEFVKKVTAASSKKEDKGAMATFYNPFDVKKKSDNIARVAEEEERSMSVQFGNRLSIPLEVRRCQLEFNDNKNGRVKAAAHSFVVPPKSKAFTVHFPFTILSRLDASDEVDNSGSDENIFEVKGMTLTFLGRCFFLPIHPMENTNKCEANSSGNIPVSASEYVSATPSKAEDGALKGESPRLEAYPCQPRLQVIAGASGARIGADTELSISLSNGEIYTTPSFRLENYAGSRGHGKIERLQISIIGLPGLSEMLLYDSDSAPESKNLESEEDFISELVNNENPPPLKARARVESLNLKSINGEDDSEGGKLAVFEIAAAHNFGQKLPLGKLIHIRFRYRGLPSSTAEVWRKVEVAMRIAHVKGPRVSSMTFRPDLHKDSSYKCLCQSPVATATATSMISEDSEGDNASPSEEFSIVRHLGVEAGVHVCSNEIIFLLTVANDSSSTINLSRPGSEVLGGFDGSPLQSFRVNPGVGARIPIAVPRFSRTGDNDALSSVVNNLVARTSLIWEAEQDSGRGRSCRGRIRIPPACLQDIIHRYPSFVTHVCQPPCTMKLLIEGKEPKKSTVMAAVGSPVNMSVEIDVASWVPKDVLEMCSVTLEFCCAREDGEGGNCSKIHADNYNLTQNGLRREYVWCGKEQQKFGLKDLKKKHCVRIAFVGLGQFAISACARISQTKKGKDEIWLAPMAQTVLVDKADSPVQQ